MQYLTILVKSIKSKRASLECAQNNGVYFRLFVVYKTGCLMFITGFLLFITNYSLLYITTVQYMQ